jgi:hypothetical protein
VSFVLCLDTLGNTDKLNLHVSKPPKEGSAGAIFLKVKLSGWISQLGCASGPSKFTPILYNVGVVLSGLGVLHHAGFEASNYYPTTTSSLLGHQVAIGDGGGCQVEISAPPPHTHTHMSYYYYLLLQLLNLPKG